mmetsp:Transcript_12415/g.26283  ORF Transcript_12415/g.26283 Transcript_12415/m.26283 type:complete len:262 (-) Transcript_12415:252-1037(-)|eukprot:CAMPEP_0201122300 /NCGR_PEP_ID=MMETSP0850-20130426/5971_1 /ASSEMBLY_ACC=CAM_ASM_000622 /TAXON_ID=183588 /ORGANISM="Pseudo-nitzschia fraudulenta, Strain WWA7" /LENGTH=261 /DNA_ID=CAMNT_0047388961 /DNA_START=30 /DNA_END=815 /DNA_ORIENTATION=+
MSLVSNHRFTAAVVAILASSLVMLNPSSALVTPPQHLHHHRGLAIATRTTTTTTLFANSKNIRAAMEATEQYGIHSPEARLAWEVVEEFDASTNDSAAYEGDGRSGLSQEELTRAYEELQASMEIMQRNQYAAVSFQNNQQLMKDVAAELQAIKLSPPERKPSPKIPGLWDAKLKARATSMQFGNESPESKLAWEEVEEIASSGLQNAVGGNLFLEDTCDLVQAAEACMALEELDRFLYYENYHVGDNVENNNEEAAGGYY